MQSIQALPEATKMFLQSTFANFLGSFMAALVTWLVVARVYDISRSKKTKDELPAVSYALIKREIDACSGFCRQLINAQPTEILASGPITQAWQTLHSMEAFKYFPPKLSEKLVKYYSLIFRLKANIEMSQMLYATAGVPVPGADPMAGVQQRLRNLEDGVCKDLIALELQVRSVLDCEVSRLKTKGRRIFKEAYEEQHASTDARH
jgi:hypothetical protein